MPCCVLSCRGADAVAIVAHSDHGRRAVCADHINGHRVVEWLDDDARVDHEGVAADV